MPNLRIVELDPLTDPRWDRMVERHPVGWLTHTSTWARILLRSFPHLRPHYLALEDATGELWGGLAAMEFSSRLTGRRLVSLPYSTLCDPLVRTRDEWLRLLEAADAKRKALGLAFLEVRSSRTADLVATTDGIEPRRDFAWHRLDLRRPLEEILKCISRRAVRPCIHRAERLGLRVRPLRRSDFESFWRLYVGTHSRLGLPVFPRSLFRRWLDELLPRGWLRGCVVEDGDQALSVLMAFVYRDRMSAEVIGSEASASRRFPSHIAFWDAIREAHALGLAEFDFGRTPVGDKGLMDFKRHWGTRCELLTFAFLPPSAAGHADRNGFSRRAAGWMCNAVPQSVLPAVSRFVYRHAG
ncbi:MAG TPA: GNAT family N-acetyltransferase [Acidobacteriota bacterium]|nr:GNAT family N-acetyltransferase [Acidobacteriota bacterium]HRV09031.1 GNAT family N-acetyltransferase [Acidobacteriota bacterium]